jgi:hypothetical protein
MERVMEVRVALQQEPSRCGTGRQAEPGATVREKVKVVAPSCTAEEE